MTDIVEFLTARIAEDEAAARAATPGPWRWGDWSSNFGTLEQERNALEYAPGYGDFPVIRQRDDESVGVLRLIDSLEDGGADGDYLANGGHIARHDPARVLAEVKAKRRVLERHRPATGEELGWSVYAGACLGCGREGEFADPRTRDVDDCPELRDLASVYAERPGYKERWRVA